MHVVIIGAGVVGVNSAYLLLKKGFQVSIVDSHDDPAQEASFANGCQLSYNYVAPLASPAVFNDLPKWLFNPNSPLRFYPRLDWQQWRWLAHFVAACTQRQSERSTAQLLGLALRSKTLLSMKTARRCSLSIHGTMPGNSSSIATTARSIRRASRPSSKRVWARRSKF